MAIEVKKELPEKPRFSLVKLASIILPAILIIVVIIFLIPTSTKCGFDQFCFIEKAELCESVEMKDNIGDGTIAKYEAKDCILTKEIETFSQTEPIEVINFFQKKTMECRYEQNNFDASLIQGLSIGIESCQGSLADAINELRLAQIALSS